MDGYTIRINRREFLRVGAGAAVTAGVLAGAPYVRAQGKPVIIGVLTDQSKLYQKPYGDEHVRAARLAVKHFGKPLLGQAVEVRVYDHASTPDVGVQKAEQAITKDGVSVITGNEHSGVALAVQQVCGRHNVPFWNISAASTVLVGKGCNAQTIKWCYNNDIVASALTVGGLQQGKKFYTLTHDYAWGHDLRRLTIELLKKHGGSHLGDDPIPQNAGDYSSFILKAKASNPDVVLVLVAGADAVKIAKQAKEFGIKQKVFLSLFNLRDVEAAGLDATAGAYIAAPWDASLDYPAAREFSAAYKKEYGLLPAWSAAGQYCAAMNFLKTVEKVKSVETRALHGEIIGKPLDDVMGKTVIRKEDHQQVGNAYLVKVKERDEPGDPLRVVVTIGAKDAYPPPSPECKMGKA